MAHRLRLGQLAALLSSIGSQTRTDPEDRRLADRFCFSPKKSGPDHTVQFPLQRQPKRKKGLSFMASPDNTMILDTTKGKVVIEMRPDLAPGHVARIKELVKSGFYDGVVFHRVIDGFMAQTDARTAPAPAVRARSSRPSSTRSRMYAAPCRWRGRRARIPATASSSSASTTRASSTTSTTVWGKVIEGMENVDKIKRGEPVSGPDKIMKATMGA